jgi:hypothetical protein
MSLTKDQTIDAAKRKDWSTAYLYANGLNMEEMLSAFASLSKVLLSEMKGSSEPYRGRIDMPRVQYAMQVVQTRTLPGVAPGDLSSTGQVGVARRFLATSTVVHASTPSDASGGLKAIIRALDEKRLRADMNNVSGQLRALANDGSWTDPGKHVLRASPGLINLLAGLLDRNAALTIMSLFRFKGGPHGEPQPDGSAIGRAVDIMGYQGFNINLKTPSNASNAIGGVAAVISNLPAGRYTIGLPRPGGGALIDPSNDVFFPVTSHDQVDRSPGGSLARDLEKVLEPARTALKAATASLAGAHIQFMFPDGVDHVHVKALD